MSKLADKLSARGVYNPYYFYGNEPYVGWAQNGGRSVLPPWFSVNKHGEKLSEAWYEHGSKCFSYYGKDSKPKALADAISWASERFGIKEWARDPFGSWGEAAFVRKRTAEILALPEKYYARK